MLAGISVEYYLRLERGRAQNPSPQIIDALARALRLDAKATRYLHALANPHGEETSALDASAYGLSKVIDQFLMPAILTNRYRDVLAANQIARALTPEFTPGQKLPTLATLGPRCQAAVPGLGRCSRGRGKRIARTQRFLSNRSAHARAHRRIIRRQ